MLSMRQLPARGYASLFARWWPLLVWTGLILLVVAPWRSFQDHSHWARVQWIPFVTPPVRARDIIGNVVLYVPFGYFLVRALPRSGIWPAVALAFTLSLATEFSQVYSHGRFPSTGDLICNVSGGWLGARWARRRAAVHGRMGA